MTYSTTMKTPLLRIGAGTRFRSLLAIHRALAGGSTIPVAGVFRLSHAILPDSRHGHRPAGCHGAPHRGGAARGDNKWPAVCTREGYCRALAGPRMTRITRMGNWKSQPKALARTY